MQMSFGRVAFDQPTEKYNGCLDETFKKNNSIVISKLTDMMNMNLGKRKPTSFERAATLVWLASCFCATAPTSKTFNLFNVSQLQMAQMSEYMVESIYEKTPEKQHVTTIMRGTDATDRIMRINLAVRMFACDSEVCRDLLPKVSGLNATIHSPVMVFTGVHNNQAAAVYLSSETTSTDLHQQAVHAFLKF
jgi:hypothetical protein